MKRLSLLFGLLFIQHATAQLSDYDHAGQWSYGPGDAIIEHKIGNDQYVFFAEGGVLHVALINASNQPVVKVSFSLTSPIKHIAISPDATQLVTSDEAQWVTLLNISNPESPYLLGKFNFSDDNLPLQYQGGAPYGLAYKDNQTLIATVTPKGLFALDVSDPTSINIIGDYTESGTDRVWDVKIFNDHAWVADGYDGLSVFDISDTNNMNLVLRDTGFSRLTSIYVENDKAYLGMGNNGIKIIQMHTQPVVSFETLVTIQNTVLTFARGGVRPLGVDKVVVADFYDGLKIFSIDNPLNPVLLHNTTTGANKFTVHDQIAHVITPTGFFGNHDLESYDFSNVNTPNPVPTTPLQALPLMQNSISIFSDDRYVLASTDHSGLALLNISNPSAPSLYSQLYSEQRIFSGVILGDLVLATTLDQLLISDISNPAEPIDLPAYDLLGTSFGTEIIVAGENQVIIGGDTSGQRLKWLEVSPSGSVTLLGQWTEAIVRQIAKKDDQLAVSGGSTFTLIDFTELDNPQTLFQHTLNRPILDLDLDGDYLYIANGVDGVRIWDVSDPANANEVSFIDYFIAKFSGVAIHNGVAFLAAEAAYGLLMFDVSDPLNPVYLSRLDTPGLAKKVTVSDKVLAIADDGAGVIVFQTNSNVVAVFANGFE